MRHFFEPSKKLLPEWGHAITALRIPPCRRRLVGTGRNGHCGGGGRISACLRRHRQTCRTRRKHGTRTRGDTAGPGHNEPAGTGGCSATRGPAGAHSSGAHTGPSAHLRAGTDRRSADLRAAADVCTSTDLCATADLRTRPGLCTCTGRAATGTCCSPIRRKPVLVRRFVVIGRQQVDLDDATEPSPDGGRILRQQVHATAHHLQGFMTNT